MKCDDDDDGGHEEAGQVSAVEPPSKKPRTDSSAPPKGAGKGLAESRARGKVAKGTPKRSPTSSSPRAGGRRGVRLPNKLLMFLNEEQMPQVIWWMPDGNGFAYNAKTVQTEFLDKCFRGTKLSSFVRSLNRWGFRRVFYHALPEHVIAFYHPQFKRDHPEKVREITMGALPKNQGEDQGTTEGERIQGLQVEPASAATIALPGESELKQQSVPTPQHQDVQGTKPALRPVNPIPQPQLQQQTISGHQQGAMAAVVQQLMHSFPTAASQQISPMVPQQQVSTLPPPQQQHQQQQQQQQQQQHFQTLASQAALALASPPPVQHSGTLSTVQPPQQPPLQQQPQQPLLQQQPHQSLLQWLQVVQPPAQHPLLQQRLQQSLLQQQIQQSQQSRSQQMAHQIQSLLVQPQQPQQQTRTQPSSVIQQGLTNLVNASPATMVQTAIQQLAQQSLAQAVLQEHQQLQQPHQRTNEPRQGKPTRKQS